MWEKTAVSLAQDIRSGGGWWEDRERGRERNGGGGRETRFFFISISCKALFDSSLKTHGPPAKCITYGCSFLTVAPKIAYKQYIAT